MGYKEVRLASKEARQVSGLPTGFLPCTWFSNLMLIVADYSLIMQRGGDRIILCFVDFVNPECAETSMNALQGDNLQYSFL